MSCYHPLIRFPKMHQPPGSNSWVVDVDKNGEVMYSVRAARHEEIEYMDSKEYLLDGNIGTIIPCGHCIGCKLDYSRQWADRMMLELEATPGNKAIFVTLTYENPKGIWIKHPDTGILGFNYTLVKRDLQGFNKRLRKKFDDRKLRFYGAGEYGETTLRPHYHEIIFGIDLNDVKAIPYLKSDGSIAKNGLGDVYYISKVISDAWSLRAEKGNVHSELVPIGLCSIGKVNWTSCAYVARYVAKKWSTGMPDWIWNFLEKPFTVMSLKPGIGYPYIEYWRNNHPEEDILDYNSVTVSSAEKAKKIKLSKYLKNKAGSDTKLLELKLKSLKIASDRRALMLSNTDLDLIDLLSAEEQAKIEKTKILKRR